VRQSVWHTHNTSPKTETSAKPVPVIEPLGSILVELRQADGNPVCGPILRGPSGKPLDLHNLANRVVIRVLKDSGIPRHGLVCAASGSRHGSERALKGLTCCKGVAATFERQHDGTPLRQRRAGNYA
jgi:hypothetical protein